MLTRRAPMRRTALRRRREEPRRSERVRDLAFLSWVHTQPCVARALLPTHVCEGPIEADHLGVRPIGRKADDRTCAPLCRLAHRQRTDFTGPFRSFTREGMRVFVARALAITAAAWAARNPITAGPAAGKDAA